MQKLRFPPPPPTPLKIQSYQRLSLLKSGVGQNRGMHASPAARNSAFFLVYYFKLFPNWKRPPGYSSNLENVPWRPCHRSYRPPGNLLWPPPPPMPSRRLLLISQTIPHFETFPTPIPHPHPPKKEKSIYLV